MIEEDCYDSMNDENGDAMDYLMMNLNVLDQIELEIIYYGVFVDAQLTIIRSTIRCCRING